MYLKFLILETILLSMVYLCTLGLDEGLDKDEGRNKDEGRDKGLPKKPGDARILGGHDCDPLKFEFYVTFRVTKLDGSRLLCAGSILTPTLVLTSAHCSGDIHGGFIMTKAVRRKMRWSFQENITIRTVHVHKKYNKRISDYDYAVAVLAKPMNITKKSIVRLADQRYLKTMFAQKQPRVDLFGYGQNVLNDDGTTSKNFSIPFQCVSLRLSKLEKCGSEKMFTEGRMFCAMSPPRETMSAAPGDSGGPVMFKNIQVGVISNGYPGRMTNIARVDAVLDWIRTFTGGSIVARSRSGQKASLIGLVIGGTLFLLLIVS